MKRVIKDFKTISEEVMALINEQYPYGYEESQLVTFVNAKGEFVKALEVRTEEVCYLIKLDRKLDEHINEYTEGDDSSGSDDSDFAYGGDEDGDVDVADEEPSDDDDRDE